jgi:hypothetical protein
LQNHFNLDSQSQAPAPAVTRVTSRQTPVADDALATITQNRTLVINHLQTENTISDTFVHAVMVLYLQLQLIPQLAQAARTNL